MTAREVLEDFMVEAQKGLSAGESMRRLKLVGPNRLKEQKKVSPVFIFFSQFTDFMVLVLMAASVVSGFLGEYADSFTILFIIVLNAVLGFIQEYRAEKSLDALKKMTAPEARLIREGRVLRVPAEEVVPGDIVVLETGDLIPADLRIIEANQLEVNEATLTGESLPARKRPQETFAVSTTLADRKNMGYMGTVVTRGRGTGVVVGTGMATEMGQIAGYIQQVQDEDTPLQKRLAHLGRWLVMACLAVVALVVAAGIMRGEPAYGMFLTGVSLAVAAIPEGLPAIVTVTLAAGVQKMVKRQAIVRELHAVETLGCATVICSDKTGTLTKNEMTVRRIYLAGTTVQVTGEGYDPHGRLTCSGDESWTEKNKGGIDQAMKIAALCNNASLRKNNITIKGLFRNGDRQAWKVEGDPTEGALLVAAAKAGLWRETLERKENRVREIPFDSERKRMSVVYETKGSGKRYVYCKGAPDVLLDLCRWVWWNNEIVPLKPELKKAVLQADEEMAGEAMRVLGLAFREIPAGFNLEDESGIETDLVFVALAGMIDPPKATAREAVGICRAAGIKTVMITGDHKRTAEAIAKEVRIITGPGQLVLTGPELDGLSDYQLGNIINQVAVFARVSPKHKIRIVRALKNAGHIVAMTGDGVNDAPAVKEADIGVSMGIAGTDVTREASSLVLGNDDFATIVAAVEEGRIIYDNIRKFIRYLLSCNAGEIMTMFAATLLGLPLPLIPIQILWMNLVTDGLPAMALGFDPGDPDIMNRRPRSPRENIFAHGLSRRIIVRGFIITAAVLFVYITGFFAGGKNLELARTMAFTTLVFVQLLYVFDCRSERYSIFDLGFLSNPYLVGAVTCSIIMQLAVIYVPAFQGLFGTVPLELWPWGLIISLSIGTTLLQGLYRTVKIRRKRRIISLRA
ncbi:MAG: cation-translocating P-type ATPase [Peptococcaceae bacterium]|nr:cation-translocating P-type ATPase [Peptococcaceae bacterium]MDH7524303.1 cation-translocating P-type ATPase [Peptococcaceae bacterium]